jgi:hypothetical protein
MKRFDDTGVGLGYSSLPKVAQEIVIVAKDLAKKAAIITVRNQFLDHDIVDFAHTWKFLP